MASPGIKKVFSCLWMVLFASIAVHAGQTDELKEGDLLFCISHESNAITSVTSGVEQLPIDHVGIIHYIGGENGALYVIEAVKPVVKLTFITTFMKDNPHLLIGRVNAEMDVTRSVRRCLAMVGKPYDDLYLPGDSAIYCSELVQLNFVNPQDELVFEPVPMSFHDASGQVTDYWKEFYAERGMAVPEGAPGSNPAELSRRPQVTIVSKICFNGESLEFQDVK